MKKHDMIFMIGLIVLSVLSSFLFTFYGMTIIMSGTASQKSSLFAYVTMAYGLGNLTVLSIAWSSREAWAVTVNKLLSLCFLGVFIMDMFRSGMKGNLEIVGVLILVVILCANWFATKAVVERK